MKHNNAIPDIHFHKDWKLRVRTWFDQPGQKKRRRLLRCAKAAKIAPRPANGLLRPSVHCPTQRYNMKIKLGRGFTLDEIREAGLNKHYAPTIGIPIDYRRRNKSVESLQCNVARIKNYLSKLVVFPRNAKAPKKGDSSLEEVSQATQYKGVIQPVVNTHNQTVVLRELTPSIKLGSAYTHLQQVRSDLRMKGVREKRAKEAAEAKPVEAKA